MQPAIERQAITGLRAGSLRGQVVIGVIHRQRRVRLIATIAAHVQVTVAVYVVVAIAQFVVNLCAELGQRVPEQTNIRSAGSHFATEVTARLGHRH